VNFHGYPRDTAVLDLLIDYLDIENLIREPALTCGRKQSGGFFKCMAQWSCMRKYPERARTDDAKLNDDL
jgi:hypothetical protein